MHEPASKKGDPIGDFGAKLAASLSTGTFVRLVLSGGPPANAKPEKVLGRVVEIKGVPHLSLTSRHATHDEIQNIPVSDSGNWVLKRLGCDFHNALLCTTQADWQLSIQEGKRARLIRHKASTNVAPGRQHDQPNQSMLDEAAADWLSGLGVMNANGKVISSMAAKFTQINRYLEIFSHLAKEAGWLGASGEQAPDWTVADMGCGKGYLTFGLWHLARRIWKVPVQVMGVEARPDLVASANRLAASVQASELRFISGTIESVVLPAVHAFIALHACDTATDHAIRRGIDLHAQLILVAPCCQKQLRPQLAHPPPLAGILRHGLMEERMAEWISDGLRSLFLEWAGYRTKVIEFVSSDHTPKNLLIAAIRERTPFTDAEARARIQELKSYFGIKHHPLDPLLEPNGGGS